ncbi:MAG TPA: hypothetical protein V6C81_26905 [Planktothrix sp.]|jgi:hypothetical protein
MDQNSIISTSVSPDGLDGYSQRFEYRPEFGSNDLRADVIDASAIRQRRVDDLMVVRLADVFSGTDEVLLGFGVPNVYLVCPDGNGGYQKYAAKSLKRAPSTVVDSRGFVQSGILVRFKNLPPHAAARLREAMQFFNGIKFWTCLNGCLTVMERAGFASPAGGPLSDWYMPASYLEGIFSEGLLFDGQPVQFEIIRTSPTESIGEFGKTVKQATKNTPCRHADRALKPLAKQNWLLGFVETRVLHPRKSTPVKPVAHGPVAPALPGQQFVNDIHVRVSMSSWLGSLLRGIWGSHALHEAWSDRVDAANFFQQPLQPFPQKNPSLATRIKKRVIFARPVIWAIRQVLAPRFVDYGVRSERNIYDMIRTHSESVFAKYNIVLMRSRISIARINVRVKWINKLVDWVLSKHVLMSGYDREVFFAGEMWKDAEGTIHINRNSGTYQPSEEELDEAVACLQALLPHVKIVKDALPA